MWTGRALGGGGPVWAPLYIVGKRDDSPLRYHRDGSVGVTPALEDSDSVSFSSGIFPPGWVFDREER